MHVIIMRMHDELTWPGVLAKVMPLSSVGTPVALRLPDTLASPCSSTGATTSATSHKHNITAGSVLQFLSTA